MRLVAVHLTNFRAYGQKTEIALDPLTMIVGRNDSGKSSILDALDVFFNEASLDKDDQCVRAGEGDTRIGCVFEDLPGELVLDEQHPTSLASEYLLRLDGRLEIIKTYNCASKSRQVTGVAVVANHPGVNLRNDLLNLKLSELKSRAKTLGVDLAGANETIKSDLRAAIWAQAGDLELAAAEVALLKETGGEVWEQLQKCLPVFALFKSDRASTDQDSEAQDPMKAAIKEAIRSREAELGGVIADIKLELEKLAAKTVEKIREMNPDLAGALAPQVKNKNWDSLFSVSLTGDEDIPLNKRGSGTRRLVLLNFFRAQAEEVSGSKGTGIIYAIEEPETSQHPNHQILLLEAFEQLVCTDRCQIILTTHTPTLARRLPRESLRLVRLQAGQSPTVQSGAEDETLRLIVSTLGVLPDHDVKVFLGVEGKYDIEFLRRLSANLARTEPDIPDLAAAENAGHLVFVSLGGSSLQLWTSTLAGLNRPEFYLTDRDTTPPAPAKYQAAVDSWNARGCTSWVTGKRELENYIHPDAIRAVVAGFAGLGTPLEDVPMLLAEAVHMADPTAPPWALVLDSKRKEKASHAKKRLNTDCVGGMSAAQLSAIDGDDEVRSWLRVVGTALRA